MMKKLILSLLAITIFAGTAFAMQPAKGDSRLKDADIIQLAKQHPILNDNGELQFAEPSAETIAAWWNSFNDPTLTALIEYSLKNSKDLNIARSKVIQARAGLKTSGTALLPWLNGSGTYQRARRSQDTYPTAGGEFGNLFSLGLDASWEIDIFGGKTALVKAASASLQAQYAMLYQSWVTLSSEIAMQYINLRTYQRGLQVAEENYRLQESIYEIIKSRYDAGLTDQLELNQAKYVMEQSESLIPPYKLSIEETKNALAVLVGKIPGELETELAEIKPIPVASDGIMYGIPANMIRQRPDIQAAERQVAAAFSRRKSAKADLWPKFFLAGSLGTEAIGGSDLFKAVTRTSGFGPSISLPIFHWGAIKANIKNQTEAEKQALLNYEKTVLNAVAEVRNALEESVRTRERRDKSLKEGLDAAKAAVEIAEYKYKSGLSSFDAVINAQQAYTDYSQQYALVQGSISQSTVKLFKALGGGWQPIDAELTQQKKK